MKKLKYDIKRCQACKTCELACAVGHSQSKDLFLCFSEKELSLPRIKISAKEDKNFPVACRHCEHPACVDACIANALVKDPHTGLVLYDKDKCVGCWMCVMVCPYGAIRPQQKVKKVVRCDMCPDVDTPRCLASCPVKAILLEQEK